MVDWMRKDLGIAIDAAQTVGAALPVTKLVDSFYACSGLGRASLGYLESYSRLRA